MVNFDRGVVNLDRDMVHFVSKGRQWEKGWRVRGTETLHFLLTSTEPDIPLTSLTFLPFGVANAREQEMEASPSFVFSIAREREMMHGCSLSTTLLWQGLSIYVLTTRDEEKDGCSNPPLTQQGCNTIPGLTPRVALLRFLCSRTRDGVASYPHHDCLFSHINTQLWLGWTDLLRCRAWEFHATLDPLLLASLLWPLTRFNHTCFSVTSLPTRPWPNSQPLMSSLRVEVKREPSAC